jgi:hypothetical protein
MRPLPEDWSGANTVAIVHAVRCEARKAIVAAHDEPAGASAAYTARTYDRAAIAYEFTLDMTEANNLGGGLDFTDPFSNGVSSFGIGAANNRSRKTSRNFRIVDSFGDLRTKMTEADCSNAPARGNWQYPLTGSIGLGELITTFVELNNNSKIQHSQKLVPVLSDTLTFETTVSAEADATVVLSPVGRNVARRLRLASASANLAGSRIDKHSVVIALSLPLPTSPAAAKRDSDRGAGAVIQGLRTLESAAPLPGPIAKGSAEQRALDELDRQEYRSFGSRGR